MSVSKGLSDTLMQAFSWMLIHSVWQGIILAVTAGIILAATKKTSSAVRYNLILLLFTLFLLITAGTFIYEYNVYARPVAKQGIVFYDHSVLPYTNTIQVHTLPRYNITTYLGIVNNYISRNSFFILVIWLIFFVVKSVMMAGNMLYIHKAKRYRIFEPTEQWKEKLAYLSQKLQLKRAVLLLESGYLKVPVVVGYFKPVILMPVGLLAGISAEQVEAVLLHELAHIKRSDYAVNFLQSITEVVFFFNPGLLWISSLLREERENCCDDMAIDQTKNKEEFIQALISFKDYSLSFPAHTLAFSGQKSGLLNRVMRIVYQENKTLSIKENGIFIISVAMLSLMAFSIYPLKKASHVNQLISKSAVYQRKSIAVPANNFKTVVTEKRKENTAFTTGKNQPANEYIAATTQPADTTTYASKNIQQAIAKANLNDDKFYLRRHLDNGDDLIQVLTNGSKMMVTLKPDAKIAILIDGKLYSEGEAANMASSQVNSYPGKLNSISGSGVDNVQKLYPDINLSKYDGYVVINADLNMASASKLFSQKNNPDRPRNGGGGAGYFMADSKPKADSP